jgi:hypothetical protein
MRIIGTTAAIPRRTPTGRSLSAIGWVTSALVAVLTWAATPARAQPPAGPPPSDSVRTVPAAEEKAATRPPKVKADEEAAARAVATKTSTLTFRSIIQAELRFIRAGSGASDEQARRMTREARGLLKSTVARYVDMAMKARRENAPPQEVDWTALYLPVQRDLVSIAKGQLSPEQWTRFQEQVARREEFRKRLVVRGLVVRLDAALGLTAEQLEKLAGSLRSHWDQRWEFEDIFNDQNGPFPDLPDAIMAPFLTEAQNAAWKKLEKKSVGSGNGTSSRLMVELEVAALLSEGMPAGDDLDAKAAPKP